MSPMNSADREEGLGPEGMSVARMVDLVKGKLSAEEAAEVEAAVSRGDEDTRSTLLCVRQFLAAAGEVNQVVPPPELRQALLGIFRPSPSRTSRPGLIERIAAVLISDSWAGLAPAGVRGETAAAERHLTYSSPATDLVLDVSPAPRGHFRIDGQVLPNTDADGIFCVQVLSDDIEAAITLCDDVGEFTFDELAPGTYRIVVSMDLAEIIVEPVELAS